MYTAEQISRRHDLNLTQHAWQVELDDGELVAIPVPKWFVDGLEVADVDAYMREGLADYLTARQYTDEMLREQGVPPVTRLP